MFDGLLMIDEKDWEELNRLAKEVAFYSLVLRLVYGKTREEIERMLEQV